MSNLAIFNSGAQLPSYLKTAELDEVTKNLAGNGGGGGKRISIKGGVFRLLVNGEEVTVNEDRAMNVVIVNSSVVGRTFYANQYVEGEDAKPPTCWSSDGSKPNEDVKEPEAKTCASCPQNIKGSGQGDSRACRFSQRLAVMLEGDLEDGEVYQLSLPATSIFGSADQGQKMPMQAYARFLAQYKIPVGAVVTEMRFDTSVSTPKLTFSAVRPLTEAEYQSCKEHGGSDEAVRAITMTVSQTDNVKDNQEAFAPAPETKTTKSPAKTTKAKAEKPPVAAADVDDPVVEEPVKVENASNGINAESDPAIAELLDEWEV